MSFSTRCPQCHSVFRVDARQLVATAGRARCGVCGQPFNALEAHIPDIDSFASDLHAPASGPVAATSSDTGPHQHTSSNFEHSQAQPLPATVPSVESADSAPTADTTLASISPHPDQHAAHATVSPAEDADLDWMEIPPLSALYEPPAIRETVGATDNAVQTATPPVTAAAADQVTEAVAPVPLPAAPNVAAHAADSDIVAAAVVAVPADNATVSPFATARRSGTPWSLLVLSLLLLVLLAGQVIWHERDLITVRVPALKSALFALCAGEPDCGARLPRDLDALRLTSTELSVDPVDPHRLHVHWSMANTSEVAQQFPDVSLSLSSDGDQLLVRKNFAPGDYLPDTQAAARGIAPGSDMAAELVLDIGTLNVSNYKLLLAYPSRQPGG